MCEFTVHTCDTQVYILLLCMIDPIQTTSLLVYVLVLVEHDFAQLLCRGVWVSAEQ